ncbi:FUSC family protein [Ramlibacter humi]|uniref:FUSC family protein n=1 Tax=Ramlibacter humi TaxID=2530451 RepID=A0A4Z0BPS0_9BURK|nr:FUSC family protein [Ramlibacter humi]TFZ00055.1 FUSC family protein [Ramlibacter humi]
MRLHDAPSALRRAARVLLSSYFTNGLATALGIPFAAAVVHALFGPQAAATATVAVIVATPPDQVAPRRGKLAQLLPAALLSIPVFFAVQAVRADAVFLTVVLVAVTFVSFLGGAWGRRGLPISIALMLAMVFSLAVPAQPGLHAEAMSTFHFALGIAIYLVYAVAVNAALNGTYRRLVLVDSLLLTSRLMRMQARQFKAQGGDAAFLAGLIKLQAGLADQLQVARNVLLESPGTRERQQRAAMLLQILDMRDHLAACILDLDTLKRDESQRPFLQSLGAEIDSLAHEVEALADALLLRRLPEPFERSPATPPEGSSLLARSVAGRVRHIHEEVERLVGLARREREPDVAFVRTAWQLFVSPAAWSWKPFTQLWQRDAPPLRHAIRAALAIGVGQAVALMLPWGTHDYWILLTITVVLRGSFAQTIERRNSRVAGTFLGCVIAAALLYANTPASVLLGTVTLAQALAHAFAVRRYLVTAVAATVLALLQAHQLNATVSPVFEIGERIGDTLIGVAIAWLFSYVLPSWERTQIPALVSRALGAQARHAREALALGQLTAVDNHTEAAWRLARREVYDSLSALAQATQRAVSEPRAVRPPLESLERVLALSYQLLAQLTAVKTMLLQRRDRLRIEDIRDSLGQAADHISLALGGREPGEPGRAVEEQPETPMALPDPFEQDLTPWLARRLQLAAGLARSLAAEAAQTGPVELDRP